MESFSVVILSSQIKTHREEYHAQINRAQTGDTGITQWLLWYETCLLQAYAYAIDMLGHTVTLQKFWHRVEHAACNQRQLHMLRRITREDWTGPVTTKKWSAMTKCHIDTANRDIKTLVEHGFLQKEPGEGKNTHYSLSLKEPEELFNENGIVPEEYGDTR